MPVYNAMPYLGRAIESILSQSYSDFDFFIGDDGSTDGSWECIMDYAARDARIKPTRSANRLGPAASSNWTARMAQSPLIARMDADDICHSDRLKRQIEVLSAFPNAALVGSISDTINAKDEITRGANYWYLLSKEATPIAHASIIYRKNCFDAIGGYDESCDYVEDSELYVRMAIQGDLLAISTPLLSSRMAGTSARIKDDPDQVERAIARYSKSAKQGARMSSHAFLAIGSVRLWSGQPPGVFLRMLRRMELLPLSKSVRPLAWAALGAVSPMLLLQLAKLSHAAKNDRALRAIKKDHVYLWTRKGPAQELGLVKAQ
jgi:glycosyltransferase involved in cell wall biosynthesis